MDIINISVVVPCYENSDMLPLVMAGLLDQDYCGTYEILLCDDGSARSVLESVTAGGAVPDGVELLYVWQPHRGPRVARSRNNGIRLARGELLVFLDGDMVVDSSFLRFHWECHRENSRHIVVGRRRWLILPERDWADVCAMKIEEVREIAAACPLQSEAEYQAKELKGNHPWRCLRSFNFSLRRSDHVFFDENFTGWFGEDWELALRLWKDYGYTFAFPPHKGWLHLQKGDSGIPIEHASRLTSDEQITRCLQNVFHFQACYPGYNTGALCFCAQFVLDEAGARWRPASAAEAGRADPQQACMLAFDWLQRRSLLSPRAVAFGADGFATHAKGLLSANTWS